MKLGLGLLSFGTVLLPSDGSQGCVDSKSVYDSILESLLSEASARRNGYVVDKELNRRRVNILLFSFGELYEPSAREELVTIGSPTIVSLTPETIDLISLSHEIRSPEVERYLKEKRQFDGHAKTIDQAYFVGGFALLRHAVESATGLSVDYKAACNEAVVADVIDELYGSIEVDVPRGFRTYPSYFRGKWYPMDHFSTGKEKMNGIRAVQFMKTMPYEKDYNRAFENTTRKHVLLESLMKTFERSDRGPHFWGRAFSLLYKELKSGELSYDANLRLLFLRMISSLIHNGFYLLGIPRIGVELYVSDPANSNLADGRGGVQWIGASQNPVFKEELKSGFYQERVIKVPFDSTTSFKANPNSGNLIEGYWQPVRSRIKQSLTE